MPFRERERYRQWMREYMRAKRAKDPQYGKGNGEPSYFRILQRDHFRCQYCGKTPQDGIRLQVDHLWPRNLGGTDEDDNLITACAQCNGAKSGKPLMREAEIEMRERVKKSPHNARANLDADGRPMPDYW